MNSHGLLARQRQAAILRAVEHSGGVRVADLVREHGVSDMTIRRDLEVLAQEGRVEKVHGGATAVGLGTAAEPSFSAKGLLNPAEKQAIASRAAQLVQPGDTIGLSAGTTIYALATMLVGVPRLTVVTNSVPVADLLFKNGRDDQTVVLSGGVRTPSDALVGPVAVQVISGMNLNRVFLGVHGMSGATGFTTPNALEAEFDQAMLARTGELVVLADHTKWGTIGLCTIAPLSSAKRLITDDGLAADAQAELTDQVTEVMISRVEADAGAGDSIRSLS